MIRFENKFNSQVTGALNKHVMKKLWWVYVLFTVLFALLGVLSLKDDMIFGIIMICFGALFTPLCILLTKLLQKKIDGSMSILSNDTVETYVFDENTFTITQEKGEEFRAMTQAKYSYFHKVTETATHYYMYLSKTQCHVLPKDSLKEGTFEELDGILIARLGDRFKKKG